MSLSRLGNVILTGRGRGRSQGLIPVAASETPREIPRSPSVSQKHAHPMSSRPYSPVPPILTHSGYRMSAEGMHIHGHFQFLLEGHQFSCTMNKRHRKKESFKSARGGGRGFASESLGLEPRHSIFGG